MSSINCVGNVLTIELKDIPSEGLVLKTPLPRGPAGPSGRDGLGVKGADGPGGPSGRDGRDSQVAGPKGEAGDRGPKGESGCVPKIYFTCSVGEQAEVIKSGTDENMNIHLVIPRGLKGDKGEQGNNGKDGNHESISYKSLGNCPTFSMNEFASSYIIADGMIRLPHELGDHDYGRWFHVKTLNELVVDGLLEDAVVLKRNEARKFIAICTSDGKVKFTAF